MIPAWHRQKAGGPQLGAKGPHQRGPFGTWDLEDAEPDEDQAGEDDRGQRIPEQQPEH